MSGLLRIVVFVVLVAWAGPLFAVESELEDQTVADAAKAEESTLEKGLDEEAHLRGWSPVGGSAASRA